KTIATAADASPPSAPGAISISATTASSISLSWGPSHDDLALTGYRVYRDGLLARTVTGTQLTIYDLACGSSYTFAIEAFDAAGNHSTRTSKAAGTSACTGGGGGSGGGGDLLPPAAPLGLVVSATSQS